MQENASLQSNCGYGLLLSANEITVLLSSNPKRPSKQSFPSKDQLKDKSLLPAHLSLSNYTSSNNQTQAFDPDTTPVTCGAFLAQNGLNYGGVQQSHFIA
jgi:hypothetical protein